MSVDSEEREKLVYEIMHHEFWACYDLLAYDYGWLKEYYSCQDILDEDYDVSELKDLIRIMDEAVNECVIKQTTMR